MTGNASLLDPTGPAHSRAALLNGIVDVGKEVIVLSESEQRVWDDVQRFWAEDAQEHARAGRGMDVLGRPTPRKLHDAPVPVIAAVWTAIFLVLFDAQAVGLAVAAAALGLAVWRYWPLVASGGSAATGSPSGEPSTADRSARRPVQPTCHGRLWRWPDET